MPRLEEQEKIFLDKLSALSKKDRQTVRDFMLSILNMATIELYGNTPFFYIPYLCRIDFDIKEKVEESGEKVVVVGMKTTPSRAILDEIQCIYEGTETPSSKYVKRQIAQKFHSLMGLKDITDFTVEEEDIE